jgi:hypothetical protein
VAVRRWGGVAAFMGADAQKRVPTKSIGDGVAVRRWGVWWGGLAAFAVALLTLTPWVQVMLAGVELSAVDARGLRNFSALDGAANTLHFFSNGAVALLLVAAASAWTARDSRRVVRTVALALGVTYALLWGVTRVYRAFTEVKYILYVWPLLAMWGAVGVVALRRRGVPLLLTLGVWLVFAAGSLYSTDEQWRIHPWPAPPFDALRDELSADMRDDDALLWLARPDERYIESNMLQYYLWPYNRTGSQVVQDLYATTDALYAQRVREATDGYPNVWLTYGGDAWTWRAGQLQAEVLPALGFDSCGVYRDNERVYAELFTREQADAPAAFDFIHEGVVVRLYDRRPVRVTDEAAHAVVAWRVLEPTDALPPVSFAVLLLDASGGVVRQSDVGIASFDYGCEYVPLDLAGLPSGGYTVALSVYSWATGDVFDVDTAMTDGQRVFIATVAVP